MALPGDVTTFTLSFGPYSDAEGVVMVGAATGKLFPVDPATGEPIRLTHIATGQVILPSSVGIHLDGETGTATVGPLPHTDNAGLSTVGFAYRVEWDIASSKPSPGNKTFAVPTAKGATADFDLLELSSTPGVLVPVVTGATGPAGTIESATASGLAAGATPTVTLGGTPSARTIALGIPAGATGPSGTITSASASALAPGATPTVTLGGTPSARTMAFGLPGATADDASVAGLIPGPSATATALDAEYVGKTAGKISDRLALADNKGIELRANTPAGGISPLVDFFATTAYDRAGMRWFDEAARLRTTIHYHTRNFDDGAYHEAFEIKTSDDPTGATPNNLLTRVSVRTNKTQANGSIWMSGDVFLDGARPSQQVTVERQPTSPIAGGASLTLAAGGASPGATNTVGGDIVFSAGASTGSARAAIRFNVPVAGASGSGDNVPTLAAIMANSGTTANGVIFSLNNTTSFAGAPFGNTFAVNGDNDGGFCAFRRTTANSPGRQLVVQAGGATAGGTDQAGGNLVFRAGTSTGSAEGQVRIQTPIPSTSGTADNAFANRAIFDSTGAQFTGNRINIATPKTPASATAPGVAGDIVWDSGFVYVCVASNSWKRSALAAW